MAQENWQKFKEIFQDALDLPIEARLDFVRSKTAGDEELFDKVKNLLASYDEADDFIENPTHSVSHFINDAPKTSIIGQNLGAYKIESEIGRGGMGAVYLASRADKEFEKKVAVKLIKRGLDTDEIIKRFRNERQILAGLDHPNIARLVDGGATIDGLPFLVMDYVEGEPLTNYCERNDLSIDDCLKLFLKICSAVRYAHQNLIIHRDLKPSNVLVTTDGTPKLLDFGIAKLVAAEAGDETSPNTMTRVMTPEYASPEQIQGRPITTSTDVYSLGVMLYELLTGERPYRLKNKNADEISKLITDSEPLKPSSVLSGKWKVESGKSDSVNPKSKIQNPKSLKGDLDNIVLMAMRKEPERRYVSVEQFAGDIQRYLDGLPVLAQENTFSYRATKFIGRNKGSVAAGIGVAASLIAGIISTSRQSRIAKRERDFAAEQSRIAEKERDTARREARKAEKINRFLQKMLASPDPRVVGKDVKVLEVLEITAGQIETDFANQPEIAADLHTTIGLTYLSLGIFEKSEPHLETALNLRRKIFGRDHHDTAMSLNYFGEFLQGKGDLTDAEPFYRQALEILENSAEKNELDIAAVLGNFAYLLALTGENERSAEMFRREIEIRRRLSGENHPDLARTMSKFGVVLKILDDNETAEKMLRQSLTIFRREYGDEHPDSVLAMSHLVSALHLRKPSEAKEIGLRALKIMLKLYGENHPEVAWMYYALSYIAFRRDDFAEAIDWANKVLEMREKGFPKDHLAVSSSLWVLGASLLAQSNAEQAKPIFEECLELRERTLSENHWVLATTKSIYGECLMVLGQREKGKRFLIESYNSLKDEFGTEHEHTQQAFERIERFR